MENNDLLAQIERLKKLAEASGSNWSSATGVKAQVLEFFAQFVGPKSAFYLTVAQKAEGISTSSVLIAALDNYKSYIEAGLAGEVSPQRRVQLDVVSDFLEQAQLLLDAKGVHPAAPIVLIGATLEEFLRTWIEGSGLFLGSRKASLDAYSQVLSAEGLITKQDVKDLTSWAGLRNHAAHGEWDQVSDKQRAAIMLEAVNLFMRKYGAK